MNGGKVVSKDDLLDKRNVLDRETFESAIC